MPRFDCATWRPINANTGGVIGTNLGLILHHAVMNGSGWNLFNNPSTRASAHFWVFKDGRIEQYVDSSVVAWHGISLNSRYVGVETEGCGAAPHAEAMTEPMVAALARLYAEGARRHGWPNALISSDGQRGFGFHRMAVATACPCDVRLNRRQEILNRAFGGGAAPAPPAPAPPAPAPPPAGGAPPFPGRIMRNQSPMMQGADIQQWQTRMRARGWSIDVDGWYGPGSAQVARQFQAEKGLAADGEVGPQTWAAAWTSAVT